MLMQNLPDAFALPGIEKFLYLAHRNATMFNEIPGETGIENRIIADQPILTFLDICNNVSFFECMQFAVSRLRHVFSQGIGRNSPFNIECLCSASISPPSFGGTCESTTIKCLGAMHTGENLICGYPEVGFHFDAISISEQYYPLEMHICFHEHYIFGMRMPTMMPTCFNFIGPRIFDVLGIVHFEDASVVDDAEEPHASRCTVTHGDVVCESCTPCIDEAGQIGMNFDCDSLQANLTSSDHCITIGNILFT
jgi:hypothetical protein